MRWLNNGRIVESTSLYIDEIRMLRGRSKEWRAAVRAEMTGELLPAFTSLSEPLGCTSDDAELLAEKANTNVEGTARAPAAGPDPRAR